MGPEGSHINLTLLFVLDFLGFVLGFVFVWGSVFFCWVFVLGVLQQTHQTNKQTRRTEKNSLPSSLGHFGGEVWQRKSPPPKEKKSKKSFLAFFLSFLLFSFFLLLLYRAVPRSSSHFGPDCIRRETTKVKRASRGGPCGVAKKRVTSDSTLLQK